MKMTPTVTTEVASDAAVVCGNNNNNNCSNSNSNSNNMDSSDEVGKHRPHPRNINKNKHDIHLTYPIFFGQHMR